MSVNASATSLISFFLIASFMHIAIALKTREKLLPSLKLLEKQLANKSREFKKIVKVGRTHLQDATPLTLGQEFSGYHTQLKKCILRIEIALKEIYNLAQGGTAVGTGLNTRKNFDKKIVKEISKITKIPFIVHLLSNSASIVH
jgi:fumarate hydratase class II